MSTDVIGGFDVAYICHQGHRVPYVTAYETPEGLYHLTVDNRFGTSRPLTKDELDNIMPIIANAMAVSAGYSCFGEGSQVLNRFSCKMVQMAPPAPNLRVVPSSKEKPPPGEGEGR